MTASSAMGALAFADHRRRGGRRSITRNVTVPKKSPFVRAKKEQGESPARYSIQLSRKNSTGFCLSLPRLGPLRQGTGSSPAFLVLRGSTLAQLESLVIRERNATFLQIQEPERAELQLIHRTVEAGVALTVHRCAESMTPQ
jgi:hypothetical protein